MLDYIKLRGFFLYFKKNSIKIIWEYRQKYGNVMRVGTRKHTRTRKDENVHKMRCVLSLSHCDISYQYMPLKIIVTYFLNWLNIDI